jgi:uncharacterized protein
VLAVKQTELANARSEAFGYVCRRCSKCCYHKAIQVNPYEVARLARKLGQTTTEFRNAWTVEGAGTLLSQTETGACVFLGNEGCTVHSDRPLVCRIYPLGRYFDGTEIFTHVTPHPQSAGEYSRNGTIATFIKEQDAEPFLQAADEYFRWHCAASEQFDTDVAQMEPSQEFCDLAANLTDMDVAIEHYCTANGIVEPVDIEERKQLHLKILYQYLADDEGESHGKP